MAPAPAQGVPPGPEPKYPRLTFFTGRPAGKAASFSVAGGCLYGRRYRPPGEAVYGSPYNLAAGWTLYGRRYMGGRAIPALGRAIP